MGLEVLKKYSNHYFDLLNFILIIYLFFFVSFHLTHLLDAKDLPRLFIMIFVEVSLFKLFYSLLHLYLIFRHKTVVISFAKFMLWIRHFIALFLNHQTQKSPHYYFRCCCFDNIFVNFILVLQINLIRLKIAIIFEELQTNLKDSQLLMYLRIIIFEELQISSKQLLLCCCFSLIVVNLILFVNLILISY